MPSTYSTNLRLELIASGEQANTWGNTTNTNLGTLIETAISGYWSLDTMTDADYTLTKLNGANDQARQMYLNVPNSANLTATRSIIAPAVPKVYVISNNSSGGQAVRIRTTSTSTSTTCLIPNGQTKFVVCDGINFHEAVTAADVLTLGGPPTADLQATTRKYVDDADATKLDKAGGTMTGALNLITSTPTGNNATSFNYVNTNYVQKTGSGTQTIDQYLSLNYTPTLNAHAVNVSYVSTQLGNYVAKSGATMTGALTLLSADPSGAWQATPKSWVDTQISNALTTAQTYVGDYYVPKTRTISAGTPNVTINGSPVADLSGNITISVAAGSTGVTGIAGVTPIQVNGSSGVVQTGNVTVSIASNAFYPYSTNVYVPTNGTGATGTWSISISGNAGTVTNGVYTNGSYPDPAWITSLSGNKISGTVSSATNASQLGGVAAANYITSTQTAYDSARLGGTLAANYLTTSSASTTYLPLTAGSTKPLTNYLYIGTSGNSRKLISGVFYDAGTYFPGIATYESSGSAYAPLVIVQQNNSGLIVKYNLTIAGQHNFDGNVDVAGNLSCSGTKPFRIEHPVVTGKDLYHIAVESPRADLMYRGVAALENGQAVVDIDAVSRLTTGTFVAITDDAEVVGLHNKSGFGRVRATEIIDGTFTIIAEDANSTDSVAWIVVAERAGATLTGNSLVDEFGHVVPEQPKSEE